MESYETLNVNKHLPGKILGTFPLELTVHLDGWIVNILKSKFILLQL